MVKVVGTNGFLTVLLDEDSLDEKVREQVEKAARHLYGLIHARFVITTRGLAKMVSNKNRV
jgi:casein kinase II subunit beta